MKVSVVAINLKTEKGTVVLTIDEARKLYEDLKLLFGEKTVYVPGPVVVERERYPWYPYNPIWTASSDVREMAPGTVTYCLNQPSTACDGRT